MDVLAIWRYPVKAMLGEPLDNVHIGLGGCHGDRRFVVVDASTGERIANKRGPTDPRLRACRARLVDPGDSGTAPPALRITLPDRVTAEGADIEPALSDLLERSVRLTAADAPARGAFAATGAFHDLAPIHLITTSTLVALRAVGPGSDWDVRRFRPNLVLDDGGGEWRGEGRTPDEHRPRAEPRRGHREERAGSDGYRPVAEDALLGATIRAPSGLAMTVGLPTPRCVVPTRRQDGLPPDPAILRTIVARHRIGLGPVGRQGCAGSYAEIVRAGRLRVGERLHVSPGTAPGEDVIHASLSRLFP
jgi:MOSC domain-containing protein